MDVTEELGLLWQGEAIAETATIERHRFAMAGAMAMALAPSPQLPVTEVAGRAPAETWPTKHRRQLLSISSLANGQDLQNRKQVAIRTKKMVSSSSFVARVASSCAAILACSQPRRRSKPSKFCTEFLRSRSARSISGNDLLLRD